MVFILKIWFAKIQKTNQSLMPLYKTIRFNSNTKLLIWKIEESFDVLNKDIQLTDHCQARVDAMKSDLHRRGFMSIRHLLVCVGYTDFDLSYDQNGKPHLIDGKYISITHSYTFSAIIISDNPVGIDIEKQRPKILKIAHKFTTLAEYSTLANQDAIIRKLTIVWGAKEAVYKSFARPGISFLEHIFVEDFRLDDPKASAKVYADNKSETYDVYFQEFEDFTLVYAIIS